MYSVYQVMSNDTIESIANKVGVSTNELLSLNGINTVIQGQFIVVPNNSMFDTYVIKSGDNMYEIANRYNIDLDDLLAINGLNKNDYIYPNQEILIPKGDMMIYITKENDTINTIVNKMGISIDEFIRENGNLYLTADQIIKYRRS